MLKSIYLTFSHWNNTRKKKRQILHELAFKGDHLPHKCIITITLLYCTLCKSSHNYIANQIYSCVQWPFLKFAIQSNQYCFDELYVVWVTVWEINCMVSASIEVRPEGLAGLYIKACIACRIGVSQNFWTCTLHKCIATHVSLRLEIYLKLIQVIVITHVGVMYLICINQD